MQFRDPYDVYEQRGVSFDPNGRRYGPLEGMSSPGPVPPPPPVPTQPVPAAEETVEPFSYQTPSYGGPSRPQYNLPSVPKFDAPEFVAPDVNQMNLDPGYAFRLKNGLGALQASQAGKGLLRTGGSLKALNDYAQESASQEYGALYNRALQAYDRNYTGAHDEFAPVFADYNNRFGLEQDAGNRAYDQSYNQWQFGIDDEFRREQMLAQMGLPE